MIFFSSVLVYFQAKQTFSITKYDVSAIQLPINLTVIAQNSDVVIAFFKSADSIVYLENVLRSWQVK